MVLNVTDETEALMIYVNGEKLPLTPTTLDDVEEILPTSQDIFLFNEIADEITIWDEILTESQIEAIYTYLLGKMSIISKVSTLDVSIIIFGF